MNDKILLRGTVTSELRESPGRFKEDYLQVELKCSRRGGNSKDVDCKGPFDVLKIYFQRDMSGLHLLTNDVKIQLIGEICTYSYFNKNSGKEHTNTFVMCRSFKVCNSQEENERDVDEVDLIGTLCKKHDLRITAAGKALTSTIMKVMGEGHTSFIPCIFWQRHAEQVDELPEGITFNLSGRLQSRDYTKKTGDKEVVRTTYEVVVHKINNIVWND